MARVFKRPGSDFYYGRFKQDGKEIWFSTKTTDRKEAQKIADDKIKAARGKVSTDDYFNGLLVLLARMPENEQDAKRNEYARRLMQGQASMVGIGLYTGMRLGDVVNLRWDNIGKDSIQITPLIQDLVGHGSPAMTELYSHADFEQKQNAIKSLPAMAFSAEADLPPA